MVDAAIGALVEVYVLLVKLPGSERVDVATSVEKWGVYVPEDHEGSSEWPPWLWP